MTLGDGTNVSGNIAYTSSGGVTYNGTNTRATISGNLNLGPVATAHIFDVNNGADSIDMEISGIISGTGPVTKSTGLGVLQYSGGSANTYTGLTTINAGELRLNKTPGINAIAGSILVNSGGILSLGASDQIINTSTITLQPGSAFNMNGFNETIATFNFIGGTFSQAGGLISLNSNGVALQLGDGVNISGDVALTGTGRVFYSGSLATATISGNLSLGASSHFFQTNIIGPGIDGLVISGVISGSGGVATQVTNGRLVFDGPLANTYTGLTRASAGEIVLRKPDGVFAIVGNITCDDNEGFLVLGANDQIAHTSNLLLPTLTVWPLQKPKSLIFFFLYFKCCACKLC